MVRFLNWGITDDGTYYADVKLSSRPQPFRATWNENTEVLNVAIQLTRLEFIDVKKGFVSLYSKYKRGKATPGKPVAIAWG